MSPQKARDAILVVTVFGALMLLPPILPFFARPVTILGVPLILVYVFGVWLALIVAAWLLARRLPEQPRSELVARDALRPLGFEQLPADTGTDTPTPVSLPASPPEPPGPAPGTG